MAGSGASQGRLFFGLQIFDCILSGYERRRLLTGRTADKFRYKKN
jgi:hypothetical protein